MGPELLPRGLRPEVLELHGQLEDVAPAEADGTGEGADPLVLRGAEGQAELEGGGREAGLLELDRGQEGAAEAHVTDHRRAGGELLPGAGQDLDLRRQVH